MKRFLYLLVLLSIVRTAAAQDALQLSYTVSESRCAATGAIAVFVTGGSGSYNYRATGPVHTTVTSSPTLSGLKEGYYRLWVRDINTNDSLVQDSIYVPGTYDDPRFQLVKTDAGCAGNDGTVSVTGLQHGRAPFSYTMIAPSPASVGATNSNGHFTGLPAGEYYVRLQDSCGGIQVRRITIESYSWWFDGVTVNRVGCDSADVSITLRDNRGGVTGSGTAFNGYQYGIVNAPGDTSWFGTPQFRFLLGNRRGVRIVAKNTCGYVHTWNWTLPPAQRPSTEEPALSGFSCTTFSMVVPSTSNLTSPQFCLYDGNNNPVGCNSTGSFNNLPYGNYCLRITDNCYDTTIVRCFTAAPPPPTTAETVGIFARTCTDFTASVSGPSNLFNPTYCLYRADSTLVGCSPIAEWTNLPYGGYYVKITEACRDTAFYLPFTAAPLQPSLNPVVVTGGNCTGFNASVTGTNLTDPQFCLYDSTGAQIACNTTGIFTNLPHGSYCIKAFTACGDSTAPRCFSSSAPQPSLGNSVTISNRACNTFTAATTGAANLTNPQYCLYNAADSLLACNSTGRFDNLAYGAYCIRMTDGCDDTTITRCFTAARLQPSINATIQRTAATCSTISIRVTGSNLTSPQYCLLNAQNDVVACNTTGQFTGIPYGSYCVRVQDGCVDTTMTVCGTFAPDRDITLSTSKSCTIGSANLDVQFVSGNGPYTVKIYHPDGRLIDSLVTTGNPVRRQVAALPAGLQYRVIGTNGCGQSDTASISPNATVVTRTINVAPKCPSATWQNGAGDVTVNCSSNWYSVTPRLSARNGAAFSRGFSSQSGNSFTFSDLEPAQYVMEYTMQNCNTRVYDTFTVAPYAFPTQGQSAIYQCDNNGFSLGADVAGGLAPYSYQIIGSQPESPAINTPVQTSPVFEINNGTSYSLVRLRSVDACGNATLDDVSVLPLQNIAVSASNLCFYQETTLSADTIPNATYTWYRKTSATDSVQVGSGPGYYMPYFTPDEMGTYVCKVNVNGGCLTRLAYFTMDGECGQVYLPLRTELRGKPVAEGVQLSWKSMEEDGVQQYVVERKTGNRYVALATLPARTAAADNHYQYLDKEPLNAARFYRLRVVQAGGRSIYTNIIHVRPAHARLQVYPNPASDRIHIRTAESGTGHLRAELIDPAGRILFSGEWKGEKGTPYVLHRTQAMRRGIYLLRITRLSTGEVQTERVLLD